MSEDRLGARYRRQGSGMGAYIEGMAYAVMEAVVGVGKTVLTRLLAERLHMPTLFKQFEENSFLLFST